MEKKDFSFLKKGAFMKTFLLLCFFSLGILNASAQSKTVTGIITDSSKEPLIGVSVVVKGTTNGTVSDFDGKFSISAKPGDVLVFSYLGMRTQNITVGASSSLTVVMEDDSQVLNETVVIGYGTSKKADLTGSIGSISADAITKQPALNAAQSIQGKMAGVNIVSNEAPGSSPTVIVRGMGTALGGRNPLYIVDGFPVDNINNISSSDIVSMDILKDASSASIYGVRAANGVILVTTKKGQEGKSKISVESYVGIKSILKKVKMANASEYIQYFNENQQTLKNAGEQGTYFLQDASKQAYNTDWYDELLKTGVFTNNVVSISGGSKSVDYYFSYNYYDEGGILDGQDYQRTTIRNNNIFRYFDDRLKISENMSISFANESVKPYGVFNEAYRQSPLVPTRYADGKYGQRRVNKTTGIVEMEGAPGDIMGNLNSIGNPFLSLNNTNERKKHLTIQGGVEAEFKLTDYLKVNSRFGATKYYYKDRQFANLKEGWLYNNPDKTAAQFEDYKAKEPSKTDYANNSLRLEDNDTYRWTWEGFLTFNKSFEKHNLSAVGGLSREKQDMGNTSILKGYDVPSKSQYWNLSMAKPQYSTEVKQYSYTPRSLSSYFGRVQYNYDNKYYFSGTIRRDGSSTFKASGDHWATFPSVGLGWTISRENFMEKFTFLDYLKIRGTWGKLGNQDIPLNVSQVFAGTTGDPYDYNYIFGPDNDYYYGAAFGSPALDLSWEITEEWGIGIDFAFLHDRLTGNVDYYDKKNTNTILEVTPKANSMYGNKFNAHGAEVSNRGVELSLGWSDRLANGLTYEISTNYSHNTNKVKKVRPAYDGATGGSLNDGGITKRLKNGQPLYSWWLYEVDGVWQTQEEIDDPNNAKLGTPKPGYLKYKDQDGNGVIDERDRKYFGSYLPTYNYGIHIGLGYKKFDFSVDGYGVGGNKIYNGLKAGRIDGGENISRDTFKHRWHGPGTSNTNPGANRDSAPSNYFLESGAYFRINNITLGYTFNDLVFPGSKLRFYCTAQNPFMFTNYSGFSPEISGSDSGNPGGTSGIELSAYPTTRNFVFGLNLSF